MQDNNEHDELFDELRAANPYVDEGSTPTTTTSASARFEEITMQPHDTHTAPRRNPAAAPDPWWRRPMVAAPTALALVAVLVVGALAFSAVTAPSAYALVNEAAQTSASFDSGRVRIEIELREVPGVPPESFTVEYRYQGDNFSLTQDAVADGSQEELYGFAVIRVGEFVYSQLPPLTSGDEFIKQPEGLDGEESVWDEIGFGVNPDTITPASVVGVLERADDFTEVDSPDGTTSYRGTIAPSVLQEIGAENLPPGLSLLADDGANDLPETLDVTATIEDGQIRQLVIDIIGDTPEGYTDATITTTFSELGEPQNIEAPPADQIVEFDELEDFGMPEGMDEEFEVLNELEARRPGICEEVFAVLDDPEAGVPNLDEMMQINEDFATCLEDAGEPAAAEAFRTLTDSMS